MERNLKNGHQYYSKLLVLKLNEFEKLFRHQLWLTQYIQPIRGTKKIVLHCRYWNFESGENIKSFRNHTEFVYGLDHQGDGTVVDCAWDKTVHIYSIAS